MVNRKRVDIWSRSYDPVGQFTVFGGVTVSYKIVNVHASIVDQIRFAMVT